MKARLADLGGTLLAGSPADFGKLIADETEKWGKVVKFAGTQAGVIQSYPDAHSINSVPRMAGVRLCGRLDRMTRLFCCSENTSLHSRPCNFLAAIGPTTDITGL